MNVISSGAEARIIKKDTTVVKERIVKSYRHPAIDTELRTSRTKKEVKILKKLESSGFTPHVKSSTEHTIEMDFIEGEQVKKVLDSNVALAGVIAQRLSYLHDRDIIHGDLTTSNMIVHHNDIFFVDFGLSFTSTKVEDKAVDVHLFKHALESKHYKIADKAYKLFLKQYQPKNRKEILDRLRVVENRGRYKEKT